MQIKEFHSQRKSFHLIYAYCNKELNQDCHIFTADTQAHLKSANKGKTADTYYRSK